MPFCLLLEQISMPCCIYCSVFYAVYLCQWVTHCVQSVVGAVFGGITGIAGPVAAILTWLALTYSYRMIKLSVVTQVQKYLKVEDICGSDVTDSGHGLAVSHTQSGTIQMATYASGNHMCNNMPQQHHLFACAAEHACKALDSQLLNLPYLRSCIKLDTLKFSCSMCRQGACIHVNRIPKHHLNSAWGQRVGC